MNFLSGWLHHGDSNRKPSCVASGFLVLLSITTVLLLSPQLNRALDRAKSKSQDQGRPARVFPRLSLDNGHEVEYLGMYPADARYRASSKFSRFLDKIGAAPAAEVRQSDVPPHTLRSGESVVQDYAPPIHAVASPEIESLPRGMVNNLATFAYGYLRVLQAPRSVTTDSRQRVVLSDPGVPAVHILDPRRRTSFRILGGPRRRLCLPGGAAVDGKDNIYIVDTCQQIVLVYDRYGRFLRKVATVHGENMLQQVTGIAIDRKAGHLYLSDGPRDIVFMFDLQGTVLKPAGKPGEEQESGKFKLRNNTRPRKFNYPTTLAAGDRELLVLDSDGTRIRILDLECNLVGGFSVQHAVQDHADGVAIDSEDRIYVSYSGTAEVRIYNRDGAVLASFGQSGARMGEFHDPTGLWVDAANRFYVADTTNARIQLFQLRPGATSTEGADPQSGSAVALDSGSR